jgi:hypothetical protein
LNSALLAALFAAWRYFFEYFSWRNLDWLMVATEGDGDEGNNGNVQGGQRRMNECVQWASPETGIS